MGVKTAAYKEYQITETNKTVFTEDYEEREGETLPFPNGEFIGLANALKVLTKGAIDLSQHLIWGEGEYEGNDHLFTIHQLNKVNFEVALVEGQKAKEFIEANLLDVEVESEIPNPQEVLEMLLLLWEEKYYVVWDY